MIKDINKLLNETVGEWTANQPPYTSIQEFQSIVSVYTYPAHLLPYLSLQSLLSMPICVPLGPRSGSVLSHQFQQGSIEDNRNTRQQKYKTTQQLAT